MFAVARWLSQPRPPFLWAGFVFNARTTGPSFWSPLPREVSGALRAAGFRNVDYWSHAEQREYRGQA